jgi:hypothetical protein
MVEHWAQGWPRLKATEGSEPETVHYVWNTPPRSKKMIWRASLSVEDLRLLAARVADLYDRTFSKAA